MNRTKTLIKMAYFHANFEKKNPDPPSRHCAGGTMLRYTVIIVHTH